MLMPDIVKRLEQERLIAVIVLDDLEKAVPLAACLLEAGLRAIELALRTPAAVAIIGKIKKELPDMLIGAGTVVFADQVPQVRDAGADFCLAPGTSPRVIETALKEGLPMIPGVATPSDIEIALGYKLRTLKFFPAEPLGGLVYLKSMCNPYSYLDLRFIPLGGISAASLRAYAREPSVLAVGGSWIAPGELIRNADWETISRNAREAVGSLRKGDN